MAGPTSQHHVKDAMKYKVKGKKHDIKADIDEAKHKIHDLGHTTGDKVSKRQLKKMPIKEDVIGCSYITVKKAHSLEYVHTNLVRENDFKGLAGCLQASARVATCDFCACGGADACCGKADPFVAVDWVFEEMDPNTNDRILNRVFQTPTVDNNHRPKFDVTFPVPVFMSMKHIKGDYPMLRFTVKDDDFSADDTFSDVIGYDEVPLWRLLAAGRDTYTQKLTLRNSFSKACAGKLTVSFDFHAMDIKPNHDWRIQMCQFKPTTGNRFLTYQDAHQTSESKCFSDVNQNDVSTCWADLYQSVKEAKQFIFVCGWSVNHETRLRRDSKKTFGELLLERAKSGVAVFVMLWADMSSDMMAAGGVMGTSDTKTVEYYKNTPVRCCRVSRNNIVMTGGLGSFATRGMFTHHQKLVVSDEPRGSLRAFVGGLDITDGRFDTCDHDLFKTLKKEHKDDFYNGCLPNATIESGPREPWHDIHCQVTGRAAYDIAKNFIDRSMCQADFQTPLEQFLDRHNIKSWSKQCEDGKYTCQLLRSIDSAAAEFDLTKFRKHFADKDHVVENSIQMAYIQSIMKAQKFIYIENQYFLGSAANWLEMKNTRCNHNVHRALVGRIVDKIRRGEDFAVYVLIPLFPEGDPASAPSQEIIHFQYQTIRFMYKEIADAIRKYKSNRQPSEYLQIFFAGQRHPDVNVDSYLEKTTDVNVIKALKSKRHMIYIHSKMMIVDDEYCIIGSANLNERSMAGTRDSEIALASWNTDDILNGSHKPKGEIYKLRTNLWREHLGKYSDFFENPSSLECVRGVQSKAHSNFQAYFNETPEELPYGQFCTYPLKVDQKTGDVDTFPGIENFPDTIAPIKGALAMDNNMMEMLTT